MGQAFCFVGRPAYGKPKTPKEFCVPYAMTATHQSLPLRCTIFLATRCEVNDDSQQNLQSFHEVARLQHESNNFKVLIEQDPTVRALWLHDEDFVSM